MESCASYILGLKDSTGKRIVDGGRKLGFVGFLVNFKAVKSIYSEFVEKGILKYLLTFKLSQDHLESFFGAIRGNLGCNTNPTPSQFISGYKKILIGASGRNFTFTANINEQDSTDILEVITTKKKCIENVYERYDLLDD